MSIRNLVAPNAATESPTISRTTSKAVLELQPMAGNIRAPLRAAEGIATRHDSSLLLNSHLLRHQASKVDVEAKPQMSMSRSTSKPFEHAAPTSTNTSLASGISSSEMKEQEVITIPGLNDDSEPVKMDGLQRRKIPSTQTELFNEIEYILSEFLKPVSARTSSMNDLGSLLFLCHDRALPWRLT